MDELEQAALDAQQYVTDQPSDQPQPKLVTTGMDKELAAAAADAATYTKQEPEDELAIAAKEASVYNTPIEEQIPKWQSVLAGASEGATIGGIDEVLGAAAAAWKIMSSPQKQSFYELYRENQQKIDKRLTDIQEANPGSSLVGELVGAGLLFLVPLPGTSVATAGRATLGSAAMTWRGAVALGATEGALRSKATIEDPKELAMDMGLMTLFGVGFVGAGKLATTGLNKFATLRKTIKDTSLGLGSKVLDEVEARAHEIALKTKIHTNKELQKGIEVFTADTSKDFEIFTKNINQLSSEDKTAAVTLLTKEAAYSKRDISQLARLLEKTGKESAEAFTVLEKRNPLKIAPIEMEARGIAVTDTSVTEFLAYKSFKKDQTNYAYWLARKSQLPKKEISATKSLASEFEKKVKQGQVNEDTYRLFKQQEIQERVLGELLTAKDKALFKGSLDTWMLKVPILNMFADLRYVASEIDHKLQFTLGPTLDNVTKGFLDTTRGQLIWKNKVDDLIKKTIGSGVELGDLFHMLEGKKPITHPDVVKQWKSFLNDIHEYQTTAGLKVGTIDKYAPRLFKEPADLILEIKKYSKEIEQVYGINFAVPSNKLDYLFTKEVDKAAAKKYYKILNLKRTLENVYGQKIESMQDVKFALENLTEFTKVKTSTELVANTTFKRKGIILDRFRQLDPQKAMYRYIENITKTIHMSTPLRELESQTQILRKAGMYREATYFKGFLQDMSGVARPITNFARSVELKYEVGLREYFGNTEVSTTLIKLGPQIVRAATMSIYPNLLGLNVRATVRNYTQPFTMTATEIGGSEGYKYAFNAYGKAMKFQAGAGKNFFRSAKQFLTERGLAPVEFVGENAESLSKGVMKGLIGLPTAFIKKQSKLVMSMYTHSDYQNRMVTYYMAENVAKDLLDTATRQGTKTLKDQVLLNFVEKLEPGYKLIIKRALAKGTSEAELSKILSKYLINKTQFVYGKAGLHEFGRKMGPIVSMFTKWPSATGSQVVTSISQRGLNGLADVTEKFLFPLVALGTVSTVINFSDSPRKQELFGKYGLSYWAPAMALKDIGGVATPPLITSIGGLGKLAVDVAGMRESPEDIKREFDKWARRTAQTFAPGAFWWTTLKYRVPRILYNQEPGE